MDNLLIYDISLNTSQFCAAQNQEDDWDYQVPSTCPGLDYPSVSGKIGNTVTRLV